MKGLLGDVWRPPLSMPFVYSPMAKPPPSCSVPVRLTPYNSLQVFDISKHTYTHTHARTRTHEHRDTLTHRPGQQQMWPEPDPHREGLYVTVHPLRVED